MPTFIQTREPFQSPNYPGATVFVDPVKLARYFGHPCPSEPPLSTGEYYFVSDKTFDTFKLFDWQQTSIYNPALPDPLVFWRTSAQVLLRLDCISQESLANEGWTLADMLERTCGADRVQLLQVQARSLGRGRAKVVYQKGVLL